MPADLTILKKRNRRFRVWLASGPVHVPKTYPLGTAGDGDTGTGHTVTFRPVPRMGPPLRLCYVGQSVLYYGGDSYVRGGGPATGHSWAAYVYNGTSDANYLTDRGTLVASGSGTVFTFTPANPGVYAIELHLSGAEEGDGLTAPLGYGVRFLKVFAANGYDLEGIPEITGPDADLEDGGVSLSLTYQRPDLRDGRQVISDNMRVCVNWEAYYSNPGEAETAYTWQPGEANYSPEVLFSGLIRATQASEEAQAWGIDYQCVGAQQALQLTQMPSISVGITAEDDPRPMRVAPTFWDSTMWEAVMASDPTDRPYWVHLVAGLRASDPAYHLLRDHTSIMDFYDVALYQSALDVLDSVQTQLGSAWDWLKQLESGRFARVYTDRKSIIYTGPDHDLRPDIYRPAPVIALDGALYRAIRVTRRQAMVGQVYLASGETIRADNIGIQVTPGSALETAIIQKAQLQVLETTVTGSGSGERREYQAPYFFNQTALNELAQHLYARDNAEFPAVEVDFNLFPHLDVNQPLTVELDPHTQEAALEWNAAAGGTPREVYVTGYSNRFRPNGKGWQTTLRLREATGP